MQPIKIKGAEVELVIRITEEVGLRHYCGDDDKVVPTSKANYTGQILSTPPKPHLSKFILMLHISNPTTKKIHNLYYLYDLYER